MMNGKITRRWITLAALTLLALTALLAGCGSSNLKIGWRETSNFKRKHAEYVTFDGTQSKAFRAEAGQTIQLDGEVTVEKGTLHLRLASPGGETLWEESYQEGGDASVSMTAPEDGLYTLHIEGEATSGGFDISWSVTE